MSDSKTLAAILIGRIPVLSRRWKPEYLRTLSPRARVREAQRLSYLTPSRTNPSATGREK